jgi:DNA-binding NtrC family response regulator
MTPSSTPMPVHAQASILFVSPKGDDRKSLQNLLQDWIIDSTDTCRDALVALAANAVGVVVCNEDLRDGNWSDLLRELACLQSPPPVIVLSNRADEHLWADVLRAGAYDLLAVPFEPADTLRTISHAIERYSCQRSEQPRVLRMAGVGA